MSGAASVASVAVGALLVLVVVRDVFHELFHPSGTGSLSRLVQRALWRLSARTAGSRARLAGPIMLVGVVATWVALVTLGWALVYWPYLPDGFRFASSLDPAAHRGLRDALYVSATALTTVGFGDITPTWPALRLLATLEAALGFALLTAGISWVLSIYPVLARRRALAGRTFLLHAAREATGRRLAALDPAVAAPLLAELAAALAQARVDLVQSGITYYFGDAEAALSLPAALPLLAGAADDGLEAGRPDAVRFAAAALRESVRAYAETIRATHLRMGAATTEETLARYAADHGHVGAAD